MRILLTGAAGFIGTHTAAELDKQGYQVLAFDRNNHADQEVFLGDIRDSTAVVEAAAHADGIVHLAGVLGTQETIDNPRPAAETNILGGLNVLEAARQYELPMVYIAVGNHWMENAYSITKTTTERLCRMYRKEHRLNVSIVRVMNAYGPGQIPARPYGPSSVRKIIPAFACRALTDEPIEIYGDGLQVMDLVHVSDVAATLVDALGRNGDYECGSGVASTVGDIAKVVRAEAGGEIAHLPMRRGEPPRSRVIAEPENMLRLPTVAPEIGVTETVRWYRENWLPQWQAKSLA